MTKVTVVGGGLAGLSLCQALIDNGCTAIRLVHTDDPLQASSAPLAICHPFPGRSLQPHALLEAAYSATQDLIDTWRTFAFELIQELPMLRPLQGANHDRLLRSYRQHWKHRKDPWLTIRVNETPAHLSYGPCYAVALGELRHRWLSWLEHAGVSIHTGTCTSVSTDGRTVIVDGQPLSTTVTLLCTGRQLASWLPDSSIIHEGGELGTFGVEKPLTTLISQAGLHIGPATNDTVVVGATRWEHAPTTQASAALPQLLARTQAILTEQPLRPVSAWRGVRAIYPTDRLPIAGPLPASTNTYALGAFGSKGLLWGPLAASCLARHLTHGTPIPAPLRLERIWPNP